jgi:hypothetical protein
MGIEARLVARQLLPAVGCRNCCATPSTSSGHIFFLLPLTVIMIVTGMPFFTRSLAISEQSMNAGGLPQWPVKSLVMIGFSFLLLQGLSELVKRIAIMRGLIEDPHERKPSAIYKVPHLKEQRISMTYVLVVSFRRARHQPSAPTNLFHRA